MSIMRVEFEVYCSKCGEGLSSFTDVKLDKYGSFKVRVELCSRCMELAEAKGYDEGYAAAEPVTIDSKKQQIYLYINSLDLFATWNVVIDNLQKRVKTQDGNEMKIKMREVGDV